jgi:hypothetical protein
MGEQAYLAYGIPQNRLKRLNLLQKAAYKVGAYSINAQTIEHSILGCPSNRSAQWLQAFLKPGTTFKVGDERQAYALQTPEPAVCFALCCGGHSDPAVMSPESSLPISVVYIQSKFRPLTWYIFHDCHKRIFRDTTWLAIQVFLKLWKVLKWGSTL